MGDFPVEVLVVATNQTLEDGDAETPWIEALPQE